MSQDQQDEPVQFPTETTAIGSPHVTYVDKTPVDFPAVVIYRNSKGRPVRRHGRRHRTPTGHSGRHPP